MNIEISKHVNMAVNLPNGNLGIVTGYIIKGGIKTARVYDVYGGEFKDYVASGLTPNPARLISYVSALEGVSCEMA